MKKSPLLIIAALTLSACNNTQFTPDQEALLRNPLYTEGYSESMVDTMVNLEIYNDPILEDETVKEYVDSTKETWLKVAKASRAKQREGAKGTFIPMKEYTEGEVLYVDNLVHLSPFFTSTPGPSLHIFLTKAVDPRDVLFPDESALDLGALTVVQGAQSFAVPDVENPAEYLSVVLWDTKLDRLYSFAQITPLY